MIKGLYSAVSAMVMNASRQQVLSHNIANLQTPGFKQILTTVEDFMQSQTVYSTAFTGNGKMDFIGLMGLGTKIGDEYINFQQGAMQSTENPYDLAFQGKGFFTISTPNGLRYTRDGRFYRDAENNLVNVDGYSVVDDTGQAIQLPEGDLSVVPDGTIIINGKVVVKMGIGVFEDPESELQHTEGNLFSGPTASTSEDIPHIIQGYLETSNVNPAQLMTQLVEVARSYEAAQKLVQNQDELLGKTIASLGRIG